MSEGLKPKLSRGVLTFRSPTDLGAPELAPGLPASKHYQQHPGLSTSRDRGPTSAKGEGQREVARSWLRMNDWQRMNSRTRDDSLPPSDETYLISK